jgi:hypothetical protein
LANITVWIQLHRRGERRQNGQHEGANPDDEWHQYPILAIAQKLFEPAAVIEEVCEKTSDQKKRGHPENVDDKENYLRCSALRLSPDAQSRGCGL